MNCLSVTGASIAVEETLISIIPQENQVTFTRGGSGLLWQVKLRSEKQNIDVQVGVLKANTVPVSEILFLY